MSMQISIVKHFKLCMLLQRFDHFSDIIKVKFISRNQYNNDTIFGIQVHFKMTKKCIVKHCAKVQYNKKYN